MGLGLAPASMEPGVALPVELRRFGVLGGGKSSPCKKRAGFFVSRRRIGRRAKVWRSSRVESSNAKSPPAPPG